MKKQKIFNFALTTMCVAVLSACGSSGGGSLAVENTPTTPSANANANTGADNSAALAAAQQEVAAAKAAAEKAEQAAKDAAEKAKEDTAKAVEQALKDKEAADKKAAEDKAKEDEEAKAKALADKAAADKVNAANALGSKDRLTAEPDLSTTTSFVGYKHVVKNDSNLITNETRAQDSKSSTPTPMRVQKPHASLDTIVVAEPVQEGSGAPRVYLEDFDTRFTTNQDPFYEIHPAGYDTATNGTIGNTSLNGIYINSSTKDTNGDSPDVAKQRAALKKAVSDLNTQSGNLTTKIGEVERKLEGTESNFDVVITNGVATEEQLTKGGLAKVISALKTKTDTPATPNAEKQKAQAQLEVLAPQANALKAEKIKLEQDKTDLARKITAAEVEQAKFEASNPANTSPVQVGDPLSVSVQRTDTAKGAVYPTKTDTQGRKAGGIWTFSLTDITEKHQNFTEYNSDIKNSINTVKRGYKYEGKDADGNVLVSDPIPVSPRVANAGDGTGPKIDAVANTPLASRNLDKTVAEIYGVRTKAYGGTNGFTKPFDTMDQPTEFGGNKDVPANNLPLVNEYLGDRLKHVQYGRVTSALHGKDVLSSYKEGVVEQNGSINTYVASFGEYGKEGTENHYFYRGLNNVGADELKLLKADTKNGTLVYEGHAVAYGLNNNYRGNIPVPTALGARVGFISGNHARAEVDLATNAVTGSIYNKWIDTVNSPKNLLDVNLVTFKGVIADNGNIAGTALKTDDQSTGLFGATLYGKGAEIGGTVASDNKDAKKWGAVFGGKLQEKPVAPVLPGVADGTDGKN